MFGNVTTIEKSSDVIVILNNGIRESVTLKTKYMSSNVKPLSKRFGFAKL